MALASEHSRRFVPGAYHGFRTIKMACKSERVPVDWDGSYADLARVFTEEFTQNEEPAGMKLLDRANEAGGCLTEAKRAFRLWDPKTRLAYENFVLDDARDGAHGGGKVGSTRGVATSRPSTPRRAFGRRPRVRVRTRRDTRGAENQERDRRPGRRR